MSTPRYVGPIRRRKYGRSGHGYIDANGLKVPGVTTILKALPKDALIEWAAKTTANYAVDHWDELAGKKPAARLAELTKARYADLDAASNRGTEVHRFAERYVAGEEAPVPPEIAGHTESYAQFISEWEPEPVLVEAVVMSHKYGYAGTLDAVLDIPGRGRCLLDVKTSRSGIFGETALQLAAYRYADVYVDPDGQEQPMPEVDEVFGLHVRGDGYSLLPIEAGPDQLLEFRYVMQVHRFATETSRTYVGDPVPPWRTLPRRRLEVIQP